MTESETENRDAPGSRGDRRGTDRRRQDRRSPVPPWRRPWAFVGYGVAAALVIVLLLRGLGSDDGAAAPMEVTRTTAPPAIADGTPAAAGAPVIDAHTVGDFERLIAQGSDAAGQRVRTVLFCGPTRSIALRRVDGVSRSIAELADSSRRVPGAECSWGADSNAPDFLLLVPSGQAQRFASMPEVRRGFVDRRRVVAEVEWLGRQDALALRTAGVLRRLGS